MQIVNDIDNMHNIKAMKSPKLYFYRQKGVRVMGIERMGDHLDMLEV